MVDAVERDEYRRELARYDADYLAARAPLPASLAAGAIAGFGVYLVPLVVVLGSFLALRLVYAISAPPARLLRRLIGSEAQRAGGEAAVAATAGAGLPMPRPTEVAPAPAIEPMLERGGPDWITAAALVAFWPMVMLAIGALVAWVYRARRAGRLSELERTPLEVPILPEVALFYALTAAAGLLVGIGTYVALAANLAFSWAGYLIWRRLHDRLLRRLAPAARAAALAAVEREAEYRRRHRETG